MRECSHRLTFCFDGRLTTAQLKVNVIVPPASVNLPENVAARWVALVAVPRRAGTLMRTDNLLGRNEALAETHHNPESGPHASGVSPIMLSALETMDNIAHVVVAVFFIILAASVIAYASLLLVRDLPLMVQGPPGVVAVQPGAAEHVAPSEQFPGPAAEGAHSENAGPNLFLHRSLELLSTLLFVVIVLELLKTIITYLKTHDIQEIMKEFLVVGIISSIRKILLVGAESSLGSADPTAAYIKEAGGTVITIAGILLLIAGLILLQRSDRGKLSA